MQTGIEGIVYYFLVPLMFFSFCFYLSFWKDKIILVFMLTTITPGCTAGQVMIASSDHENKNCASLDSELGTAQVRLQKLGSTNNKERDIRNFLLGVGGFILPPLGFINAALFLTDSYAADYTEIKALESSYNNMVMASQKQGCGSAYALIPSEEKTEPNA